jgi:hypothetical protein
VFCLTSPYKCDPGIFLHIAPFGERSLGHAFVFFLQGLVIFYL